ncbi:MAG: LpxD N-terminal domain-containing protein [bacterium]
MQHTVEELSKRVGGVFEGNGFAAITGVAGVRDAAPGDIAFVSQSRYAADAAHTNATALIVGRDWKHVTPAAVIRVDNPEAAFTDVARLFAPPAVEPVTGTHASAVVAKDVNIGKGVSIGACCVVEPGAVIGDRTVIYAGCYVGHGVKIGVDCKFYPHVSLREHVCIGDRVIIHDGTVVGSDGFGYNVDKQGVRTKIPQIGNVVICDDVEIGPASRSTARVSAGRGSAKV